MRAYDKPMHWSIHQSILPQGGCRHSSYTHERKRLREIKYPTWIFGRAKIQTHIKLASKPKQSSTVFNIAERQWIQSQSTNHIGKKCGHFLHLFSVTKLYFICDPHLTERQKPDLCISALMSQGEVHLPLELITPSSMFLSSTKPIPTLS